MAHRHGVGLELLERFAESGRVAGEVDRRAVGQLLPVPRHGERQQPRAERREQHGHETEQGERAFVLVAAAEDGDTREHVGDEHDDTDRGDGQGRHRGVGVGDVRGELVRVDALEPHGGCTARAGRSSPRSGRLRRPPEGTRVRRRVVDDVDAGLREAGGEAQPFDDVVQHRGLFGRHFHRPGERLRGRVREQGCDGRRGDADDSAMISPGPDLDAQDQGGAGGRDRHDDRVRHEQHQARPAVGDQLGVHGGPVADGQVPRKSKPEF